MRKRLMMCACLAGLALSSYQPLEAQDILGLHGNGTLTWTNSNTNLFYRIEWAPSLTDPNAWQSNYCSLTDIRSPNASVTSAVPMFYRVCGSSNRSVFASPPARTGQTNSYTATDDGDLETGATWPVPRFTVQADTNVVIDNLTGLLWARNANLFGQDTWHNAVVGCTNLTYGGRTDWRLPNAQELQSLLDRGQSNVALPVDHPFVAVQTTYYWTSTTIAGITDAAWRVDFGYGNVYGDYKSQPAGYVWPVCGGR